MLVRAFCEKNKTIDIVHLSSCTINFTTKDNKFKKVNYPPSKLFCRLWIAIAYLSTCTRKF